MTEKDIPTVIIYNNEKFWLQTSGRYYSSGNKYANERLLHRRIWIDNFGEIPEGHDIHHKDEDWTNSDPLNLECLPMFDHRSMHMKERLSDPHYYNLHLSYLEKGRDKAAEWHSSYEGREFHKELAKHTIAIREPKIYKCDFCDVEFQSLLINDDLDRYCSLKCRQAHYYKKKIEKRICARCNNEFEVYKYKKTIYCGRTCSNKSRS